MTDTEIPITLNTIAITKLTFTKIKQKHVPIRIPYN